MADLVKLTLEKSWGNFDKGDTVHVDQARAKTLVSEGIASRGGRKKKKKRSASRTKQQFRSGPRPESKT